MDDASHRRRITWAALLLSAAPFLSLNGYVGRENDDAHYVLAAQSLSQGHYRHWHLPGEPPITVVTPGFPALLLPAALAAPFHLAAYQILSTLFLAAAVFLAFLWFRRRAPPEHALSLAALFGLNPVTLSRAGAVMPEGAGLALGLGALLLWEDRRPMRAGILAAIACLVRPGALVFPAAMALAALLARDGRSLLKIIAPSALAALAWKLWCARAAGLPESLELRAQYADGLWTVLSRTARFNLASMMETGGSSFLPPASPGAAAMLAGAVLLALAVLGLWRARSKWNAGDWALAAGILLHLAWPWWYDRYWLTLAPFLLLRAAGSFPGIPPRRKTLALCVLLTLQFALHGRRWMAADIGLQRPPQADAYAWIQEHTRPADLFAGPFYARDTLYAGRIFLPLPLADRPEETVKNLDGMGVRYVLWEGVPDVGLSSGEALPARALNHFDAALKDPRLFEPAFAKGGAVLYRRVNPPAAPTRPPTP